MKKNICLLLSFITALCGMIIPAYAVEEDMIVTSPVESPYHDWELGPINIIAVNINSVKYCYICDSEIDGEDFFSYGDNVICFDCTKEMLGGDEEYNDDYYYEDDENYDGVECPYCYETIRNEDMDYDKKGNLYCPYCWECIRENILTVYVDYEYEPDGSLVYMYASDENATIYYTIDGTKPTNHSIEYIEPLYIDNDMVIKAMAKLNGKKSEVVTVELLPYDTGEEHYEEDEYYGNGQDMESDTASVKIELIIGSNAIYVNDEVCFIDAAPVIRNDRTMVPIRVIAETLGATVTWNQHYEMVCIQVEDGGYIYCIVIGESNIMVWDSDNAQFIEFGEIDSVAFIENGRTYLPVRFVSEALGANVEWDGLTQTVTITK